MKKKLAIIIAVIAVLVPLILIPVFYKPKPSQVIVEPEKISKVTITDSAGGEYEVTDEESISFYADLARGTKVNGIPDAVFSFKSFIFRFYRGSVVAEYRFYMSARMPDEVYFLDGEDNTYKAEPLLCRTFMNSKYAVTLYDTTAPRLTVGNTKTVIEPSEMIWNYSTVDGNYMPVTVETSGEIKKIDDISKKTLNIAFSREPSSAVITVENGKDTVSRLISDFPGLETDEAKYFRIKLEAKWNESETDVSYGSATYYFDAFVRANASYRLSADSVDRGGVIAIKATNAKAADITVECEPKIKTLPKFYDNGEYATAFLSTYYDTEPGEYTLTFTCDGSVTKMTVNIGDLQFNTKTYGNSADEIARFFSDESKAAAEKMYNDVFSSESANENLCAGEDVGLPTSRETYKTGYGLTMTLKATGEIIRHEGIDYHVKPGANVFAALSGKIVYVGKTTINGGVIVIDHGNGVRTWYERVDTSRAAVGQTVVKGDIIAVSDDSGFGDSERVHFGVSFGDTFVSPLWMLEYGIPYIN